MDQQYVAAIVDDVNRFDRSASVASGAPNCQLPRRSIDARTDDDDPSKVAVRHWNGCFCSRVHGALKVAAVPSRCDRT
jgi:hypothetical protein